jgi:hypothetical protein
MAMKKSGAKRFFANYIIIGMFDRNLKNKFLVKKLAFAKKCI